MIIHSPTDLGQYIRSQRKSQKLSQAEVGVLANLKQGTISEFENKSGCSKVETLFKLLAATNIEIHLIPKGEEIVSDQQEWNEPW